MPRSVSTVRLARQVAEALVDGDSLRARAQVERLMQAFIDLVRLLLRSRAFWAE